jgi:hypothetical protein
MIIYITLFQIKIDFLVLAELGLIKLARPIYKMASSSIISLDDSAPGAPICFSG